MIVMVCFLIIDLGLNSSLDFDVFNEGLRRNFLLGLVGLQVVIQISIFLILFLAAADTFLFRVGLLNILVRTVGWLILLHPIYIVLTIVEGLERVRQLSFTDPTNIMNHLWSNQSFVALSYIQKLGLTDDFKNVFILLTSFLFSGDSILYL